MQTVLKIEYVGDLVGSSSEFVVHHCVCVERYFLDVNMLRFLVYF